jgi:hypothetical protein
VTPQYFTIENKHRRLGGFLSSMADFTCRPGPRVDATLVTQSPTVSLYCLDDQTEQAIFVELPAGTDLTTAPFLWQTQYDLAQRLIAVPYATFRALGHALPPVANLIIVHTPGRSGSTLLSHALNRAGDVVSLSEPDVVSSIVHLRRAPGRTVEDVRDLLDCSVRFLFNPHIYGPRMAYALKLRSYAVQMMDDFAAAFPRSTSLFLYRDAAGVVASYCRVLRRIGRPEHTPLAEYLDFVVQIADWDLGPVAAYLDPGTTEISLAEQFTLMWLSSMEWYLAHHARSVPCLAVRYEDLAVRQEETLRAILTACGLPATIGPDMLDVFGRDAQAGTVLAREVPDQGNQERLTDAEAAAMQRILARHPVVQTPTFVVPGTLLM